MNVDILLFIGCLIFIILISVFGLFWGVNILMEAVKTNQQLIGEILEREIKAQKENK